MTDTSHLIVDKPRTKKVLEDETEALLQRAQWLNLMFDKNGKCYRGILRFPTKERAEEHIRFLERKNRNFAGRHIINTADGPLSDADYSYSMPMPELL
jgi:hypothetical protein